MHVLYRFFSLFILTAVSNNLLGQAGIIPIPSDDMILTPEQLTYQYLFSDEITITNVQFSGDLEGLGAFTASGDFDLTSGLLISTGKLAKDGPTDLDFGIADVATNMSRADLNSTAAFAPLQNMVPAETLEDVGYLEISFVAQTDSISIDMIFASENYTTVPCSNQKSDVLGVFMEGTNPAGGAYDVNTNIAEIEGAPINSRTIFEDDLDATCDADSNQTFYVDNRDGTDFIFNGYTKIISVRQAVVPCETYRIVFAIADVGDFNDDSALFFKIRNQLENSLAISKNSSSQNTLYLSEGCQDTGYIEFNLAQPLTSDQSVAVRVLNESVALAGDIEPLQNSYTIPAGSSFYRIPIVAIQDNTEDDLESLLLEIRESGGSFENISGLFCMPDTLEFILRDSILAIKPLPADTTICLSNGLELQAELEGAALNQTNSRQQKAEMLPIGSLLDNNFTYESIITVSGQPMTQLGPGVLTQVCIDSLDHTFRQDMDIYLQAPGGGILELTTDNGGQGSMDTERFVNLCFTVDASEKIHRGNPILGEPYADDDTLSGNFLPEGEWEDLWSIPSPVNGVWKLIIVDDEPETGAGMFYGWSMSFVPSYSVQYNWEPVASFIMNNEPIGLFEPLSTGDQTIALTVEDNFGCQVRTEMQVTINEDTEVSGLTVADSSETSLLFTWDDLAINEAYEVKLDDGPWQAIGKVDSFLATDLQSGTDYTFCIRVSEPCVSMVDSVVVRTINCSERGVAMALTAPIASCPGDATGSITVQNNTDIAYPPFTYTWSNAPNLNNRTNTNLAAGTYQVTLTDNDGCSDDISITVTEMKLDNVDITPASCAYREDAAIALTVSEGNGNYQYDFGEGFQTSNTATDLAPGLDTFFVSDGNGCILEVPVQIGSAKEPLVVTGINRTEPSCHGGDDGTIEILFSPNDNGPYLFQWFDLSDTTTPQVPILGEISSTLLSAEMGKEYGFVISDSDFCTRPIQETVELTSQPDSLEVTIEIAEEISCFEGNDAVLEAVVKGGTPTYTYEWNDLSTAPTFSNASRGFYMVTVTDANDCEAMATLESNAFTFPNELIISFPTNSTKQQLACLNSSAPVVFEPEISGGIPFRVAGNSEAYNYQWFKPDGSPESNLKDLAAEAQDTGWHRLEVLDANGCMAVDSVLIQAYPALSIAYDTVHNTCFGADEGTIAVTVTADNQDVTNEVSLRWTNLANTGYPEGESNARIANLPAGFYQLAARDQNNCQVQTTIQIKQPDEIQSNSELQDETCALRGDGAINLTPTGGTGSYAYTWSLPDVDPTNSFISSLSSGKYKVTITDENDCEKIDSFVINAGDNLQLDSLIVDNFCYGQAQGSISLDVDGKKESYYYLWENGSDSSAITGLNAGRYFVTISDNDDCEYNFDFEISQPDSIVLSKDTFPIVCHNAEDGEIAYFATGGTPPYSFSLNESTYARESNFITLGAGTYTVRMRDANGCVTPPDTTIFENPEKILFDDRALDTLVDQFDEVLFRYPFKEINNNYIVTWQNLENPEDQGTVAYDTTILVDKGFQLLINVQDITTGCIEEDVIDVEIVRNHQIFVPTGFSPNGDAKNDLLVVHGRPGVQVLSFNIYDRWGELIYKQEDFETNDFTTGWDGTFKNREMDSGLYVWTAEVLFQDGTSSFFKGKTRLFR